MAAPTVGALDEAEAAARLQREGAQVLSVPAAATPTLPRWRARHGAVLC